MDSIFVRELTRFIAGQKAQKLLHLVALLAALVGLAISFSGLFEAKKEKPTWSYNTDFTYDYKEGIKAGAVVHVLSLEKLEKELADVRDQVKRLSVPAEENKTAAAVMEMNDRVLALSSRLEQLEKALHSGSIAALELPLFQKDIEALQKKQEDHRIMLGRDVDRAYTLLMWLFGIMVTMVIATLGIAVASYAKAAQSTGSTPTKS